jgi:Mor family transcriptional regulator
MSDLQEQKILELEARIKELEAELQELKKKNARGAGRKKSYSEETEKKIQEGYYFGSSMNVLAKKYKLSKGTIFKIVNAD